MEQKIGSTLGLGARLRSYRIEAHMTQAEVARALREKVFPISREIYAQIETGRHHIPITVLMGLKKIYKVEWDEMLSLGEEDFS